MSAIYRFQKSRKHRTCEVDTYAHERSIRPGDYYAKVKYPPSVTEGPWFTAILCAWCGQAQQDLDLP